MTMSAKDKKNIIGKMMGDAICKIPNKKVMSMATDIMVKFIMAEPLDLLFALFMASDIAVPAIIGCPTHKKSIGPSKVVNVMSCNKNKNSIAIVANASNKKAD